MPKMQELRELSAQIDQEYLEMTDTFSRYQASTKMGCPPGCGKCCHNPEIEATPLEMLPLALSLLDQGVLTDQFLEMIDQDEVCFSYLASGHDPKQGQCKHYQKRPSVCRMFAVAGFRDKKHETQLSTCSLLKSNYPEQYQEALRLKDSAPLIGKWSTRVNTLDPALGAKYYRLNHAFKIIAQKLLLLCAYEN